MKNVHLACSEAFDVQLKNSGSSELVGNVPWKGQFYPGIAPSWKRRLPISRPTLNIGMGGYPSILVGSVSVCHLNTNKQTYSRPRLRESTSHLGPEFILNPRATLKSWLRDFLSSCLRRFKISKIWRRALVVAIPKPGKPVGDPKSYRPISLLCVPYKILEKLTYARVEPLIYSLLPKEQAGFRRGKSTVDEVVLLTQNIEDSFEAKKKGGAVFVNLTAAYETVWHRGLTCKLLRLLPDKYMVKWLWSLSEIEVSPLLPVTASKAGYAVLKTAFLRNRSWLPSYLTSIRTIFLPWFPESLLMEMI